MAMTAAPPPSVSEPPPQAPAACATGHVLLVVFGSLLALVGFVVDRDRDLARVGGVCSA